MVEKLKEQIYIIPLRAVQHTPRWERGKRAMKAIRDFLAQHMKSEDIKLAQNINEAVWERGSHKPPSRIPRQGHEVRGRAGPGRARRGVR